ncbi:MAG: ATP-binding protein [Candidatus Thermoplasmatota archaeon]
MTDIATLRQIVMDGSAYIRTPRPDLVIRECARRLEERVKFEVVEVVIGVRRSGKSTVLYEVGQALLAKGRKVYYINFEDERFVPVTADLKNILSVIETEDVVLLLDEPQNMPGWERWVRRVHDRGLKVYLTGSNSRLLGSELATALSGRNRTHEVFPFSFQEFVELKAPGPTPSDRLTQLLDEYLDAGGYPYPTLTGDPIHAEYRRDIVERDILLRHRIADPERFRRFVRFVLSNPGVTLSKKRIKGFLDIHHTTMRKYIAYMEDAYLLITLEKHGRSQRVQMQNPKKAYPIDNGLLLDKSGRGSLLESVVVQHIRRFYPKLYYWKDERGREVDIYLPETNTAIQVTYEVNPQNIRREEAALDSAERELGCTGFLVYMYGTGVTRHRSIHAPELLLRDPSEALGKTKKI